MKFKISMKILENNPGLIERFILLIGFVSIMAIMLSAAFVMHERAQGDVVNQAEEDAIHISQVIIRQQRDVLFSSDKNAVNIKESDFSILDESIRDVLVPFHILKIKIYNLDKEIIYSNEKNIIGLIDDANKGLDKSIQGDIVSEIETKSETSDIYQEKKIDTDVVEVYVPLYNLENKVGGAIELYLDVTRYRDEINEWVIFTVVNLGMILIIVFGISYFIIHGFAIHLRRLMDRLHKLSTTDSLTGLYNHETIISQGRKELSHSRRRDTQANNEHALGAIMFDIDDFKQINDIYGHQTGDEVLRELSVRVQAELREYDIFGRYGGEEFLVFLPSISSNSVLTIAQRLCDTVNKSPFRLNSINIRITASFGVSYSRNLDEDIGSIIKRADEALYISKRNGKNQVNIIP